MFLFGTQVLLQQPVNFWVIAIGIAFLCWGFLGFLRVLLYCGQQQVADGWDLAREKDLNQRIECGRRVQQVLGVSLHTALRAPAVSSAMQLDALLDDTKALKAQSTRSSATPVRHSRLAGDADEVPELALRRILTQVMDDLRPSLIDVPDNRSLALLLEVESALAEDVQRRIWHQVWSASGVRQPLVDVEGGGLAALDLWLDQRIHDSAMLLVVAVRLMPKDPKGTAEAAVGLLFGNPHKQNTIQLMAHLHRPELEREPTSEALLDASRQALDWASVGAQSVEQTWRVGIDPQRAVSLASVLNKVPIPAKHGQGFHDLDASLGHPSKASPWLAIAAAAQTIQRGAGPQFIFSGGGGVYSALWSTVLTPVPSLRKQEL